MGNNIINKNSNLIEHRVQRYYIYLNKMQPFENMRRLILQKEIYQMFGLKIKLVERITTAALAIITVVMTILCYNYYFNF